ncbi:MAG: ABC transporter ATP-binding protein/permease, partial [Oscillospiraceae bacterium]|nr:ABC transporter ATP-binding protein/permease [Oscillospiraceae bacterium]
KTFNVEKNAEQSFSEIAKVTEKGKYRFNIANANVNAFANMLSVGVQFAIFLVSGWFVLRGNLTVGAIVAITQLSGNIVAPIMQITQQSALMKSVKSVNDRVLGVMRPIGENNKSKILKQLKSGFSAKNLTFSYDGIKQAVNGLTYDFKKGGKYAIVGGSGSGKSTFLRLLTGYYDNYGGELLIDGMEIRDIRSESIYSRITMLHQNVFLFDDSLRNNITLYNQYSDTEYENVIEKANLSGIMVSPSDNALTKLGESGKTLSGGERQRVAIARAMIKGCDVLTLDEATANLDNETAYNIEKSLLEVTDLTYIFVTHRYNKELLRKCDGIIVMHDGEIVDSGNFDELYDKKGYFYSLYTITEGVKM